jgi:NTE family protein
MVALTGLLPEGEVDGSSFAERAEQLHPGPWPIEATWLCAVDLRNGRRTVFGRDDVETTVGPAVQASSAVPGYFAPVEICSRRYVDGGVHSSTNADLLAPLHLDLVVVSSSKTASPTADSPGDGSLARAWHSRTLRREVELITTRGTMVLVLQPTTTDLATRGSSDMDDATTLQVCANGQDSALARLAHPDAAAVRRLLEKASSPT